MTDVATTTDTTSIEALAHKAVSTPDDLTTAERIRLGAWIVDRREQVAAHYKHIREASAANSPVQDRGAPRPMIVRPSERLAAQDPTKQVEHQPSATAETTS